LENHLTSWAVLFLLNLISGKNVLRTDDDGYLTKKNINFAFLRCMGVRVLEYAAKFPEKAALERGKNWKC